MRIPVLVILVQLCLIMTVSAQSLKFTIPPGASARGDEATEDWFPTLQAGEVGDEHQGNAELARAKEVMLERLRKSHKPSAAIMRDQVDTPYTWKSFQGNATTSGVPNDNDLAVSTSGYLISVCNTNLYKYDLNNDSSLGTQSLSGFCTSLGNFYSKYDPKVIYDPDANKFIVVFLAGFTHASSSIIVAFSDTDHPNGLWHFYELPGNPLNDSLWSDFPMVALTNSELFITVNHLVDNESWQTGWRRTVIWQVNKSDGYAGDTLQTQLHYDITFNGKGIRNLCPVKGGSHLYGSDIYFLSQRNLDVENDTFFLVHLTDTIGAPTQQIETAALVAPSRYFVPVNAVQPHVTELATNDSRVLGAFYENDRIQFVGNTTDTLFGNSAIYHGVISNVSGTPSIALQTISDDTLCYGYPNISYAGNGPLDQTAFIIVLRSASDVFPGYSAFVTDGEGSYSSLIDVKKGDGYHYYLNGTQRWGDYTGSQRDYVSAGNVWVNGSYANDQHKVSTWIGHLGLQPPPANVPTVLSAAESFQLYPNPSASLVTLRFESSVPRHLLFEIYDANGKLIRKLMEENVRPGEMLFTFSAAPLPSGMYLLRISSNGIPVSEKQFMRP